MITEGYTELTPVVDSVATLPSEYRQHANMIMEFAKTTFNQSDGFKWHPTIFFSRHKFGIWLTNSVRIDVSSPEKTLFSLIEGFGIASLSNPIFSLCVVKFHYDTTPEEDRALRARYGCIDKAPNVVKHLIGILQTPSGYWAKKYKLRYSNKDCRITCGGIVEDWNEVSINADSPFAGILDWGTGWNANSPVDGMEVT